LAVGADLIFQAGPRALAEHEKVSDENERRKFQFSSFASTKKEERSKSIHNTSIITLAFK
jgi:hypothetical protein